MALTPNQSLLLNARNAYDYPFAHLTAIGGRPWTSTKGEEVDNPQPGELTGMTFLDWEGRHQFLLRYSENDVVKIPGLTGVENYVMLGVASILYWGFISHSPGFAAARVRRFRDGRTGIPADAKRVRAAVCRAANLVDAGQYGQALQAASSIPEFGQVSFASKLLMALAPSRCSVYDRWIALTMARAGGKWEQSFWCQPNTGGITSAKADVYQRWCLLCEGRAAEMNDHPVTVSGWAPTSGSVTAWRAVDVERALFTCKDVSVLQN